MIDYIPFYLIWFDLGSFDLLSTLAHCGVHAYIQIRKYWNWIQSISLNQRPWSIIESCRCIRNGRVCGGLSIKTAFSTDVPSIMHRKSPSSPSRLRNFSNEQCVGKEYRLESVIEVSSRVLQLSCSSTVFASCPRIVLQPTRPRSKQPRPALLISSSHFRGIYTAARCNDVNLRTWSLIPIFVCDPWSFISADFDPCPTKTRLSMGECLSQKTWSVSAILEYSKNYCYGLKLFFWSKSTIFVRENKRGDHKKWKEIRPLLNPFFSNIVFF